MQSTSMFEAEWNAISPERLFSCPPNAERSEVPLEERKSLLSLSRENVRKALRYALVILAAETAYILPQSVEQPKPIRKYQNQSTTQLASYSARPLPQPDAPIQEIIDSLDTDDRYIQFVQKYSKAYFPITPWTFASSYAYSPQTLQREGWQAPCNGLSEFACEVGTRHGKEMYLMALWPDGSENSKAGDSLEENKHRKSWHLVAFYKLYDEASQQHQYIIFNNSTVTALDLGESLDSYAAREHYEIMQPLGGIVKWERVYDDWRAKLARHTGGTIAEEDIIPTTIAAPNVFSIAKH